MNYHDFLERKTHSGSEGGFAPTFMPDKAFDFQQHLIDWSLRKGRGAVFADCGLGKTLIELAWCENIVRKTNRPSLLLTPLAVVGQTIKEAEKFGMQAGRMGAAGAQTIVVNYEQLHKLDPNDFAGVACDECFAKGTQIDTPDGKKYIEDIRIGDSILNCTGVDRVSDVHKREIQYAVTVKINGADIIASPNHPFFTQRGWVGAQHLRAGDYALATNAAMSMVRDEFCAATQTVIRSKVLRDILLSEMADASAGDSCQGSHEGRSCSDRAKSFDVAEVWQSERSQAISQNSGAEPNGITGGLQEDFHPIESHEAQTFRAWGQWSRDDVCSDRNDGFTWRRMDSGICFITGPTKSRLSDELQNRLRESEKETRNRGGWSLPQGDGAEGSGREKGSDAAFIRVDSIEILERGDNRLEQLREADGMLYFYDLGATRHPSYSIAGILVHNSSILKNFDGARKAQITAFMRKMEYRSLFTATAAPNDYIELGTSSEALGELGHMDMLGRFFRNDKNNVDNHRRNVRHSGAGGGAVQWRFKGHSQLPFWQWVSSWARACRKPSDLGYADEKFILPKLVENEHVVQSLTKAEGILFSMHAVGLKEQREERRRTIRERCEKMAELATGTGKPAILWCHLNDEGDLLEELISNAVQVSGNDEDDSKIEKFEAFIDGSARVLITKPKIGAWGLNFQHCSHVLTFASHSYEQYYQSVRRCWRFGQKRNVTVDLIATESERGIADNLKRKSEQADQMFTSLIANMNQGRRIITDTNYAQKAQVPQWL